MKNRISIIGCGWLGLPLAKALISEGYKIKGSTTSQNKIEDLKKASIDSYLIQLGENGISGNPSEFLAESETVIINIPPGLRKNPSKNHVAEITHLVEAIEAAQIKHVLYVSSTSVFKDEEDFPVIDGDTLPNTTSSSSKQLIEIEQMLQNNSNFNTTILRFGGLYDEERHPAEYLSGKKNVANPKAPINLIHKEDCIEIIGTILKNNHWNMVFNAAHPDHPKKSEYYTAYCKQHSLQLPEFNSESKSKGKIIDSTNLVQLLNYTFKQAL
ncbi:NAD(P)H-binding protein [Winogradskyella ouciana]|uniref:NAD(P)H-binding protein n=1 Tax=Winogradskyella ouciana TaxID=2608631 RepID=A0A7K1GA13_9FLAO|nr:NAD(P)H-binding protein [Winogradskyella ouciana]MTE26146.1 NAD(P)H-binding protein [Winogradskyella ouciana]